MSKVEMSLSEYNELQDAKKSLQNALEEQERLSKKLEEEREQKIAQLKASSDKVVSVTKVEKRDSVFIHDLDKFKHNLGKIYDILHSVRQQSPNGRYISHQELIEQRSKGFLIDLVEEIGTRKERTVETEENAEIIGMEEAIERIQEKVKEDYKTVLKEDEIMRLEKADEQLSNFWKYRKENRELKQENADIRNEIEGLKKDKEVLKNCVEGLESFTQYIMPAIKRKINIFNYNSYKDNLLNIVENFTN